MIVARKIRASWREVQRRNPGVVVDQFAPSFEYRFVGEHALGGVRRTRASQLAWFERLFRVFPSIEFTLRDVIVTGPPWRTRAAVLLDVRIPGERGYTEDERVWRNEIMQTVELRWGRITRIVTMTDTQREVALLTRLARAGMTEASAAPIEDAEGDRGREPALLAR
jgi:ketosteroid isomerase-like protein